MIASTQHNGWLGDEPPEELEAVQEIVQGVTVRGQILGMLAQTVVTLQNEAEAQREAIEEVTQAIRYSHQLLDRAGVPHGDEYGT